MAVIVSIFVLSILVLVHEFGHFIMARREGVRVEVFSIGFGPKLFKIKGKTTQYCISAIPFGGYIKMAGEEPTDKLTGAAWEYLSKRPLQRFRILFAGSFLNYVLGLLIFILIFYIGNPTATSKIGVLLDDMPAKEAGIKVGDIIKSVDGIDTRYWQDVTDIIHKKDPKELLKVVAVRNGKEITLNVKVKLKEIKNIFGQNVKIPLIGIGASSDVILVRYPFFEAIELGTKQVINLTILIYKGLWYIITGGISVKEAITSPIGIFVITSQAAKLGIIYLLQVSALLSVGLALTNILPIPALDGGYILFLIIEKLRGKPISLKTQERVVQVGMYLLILLMLFVVYNDLVRFGLMTKIGHLYKR